MTSDGLIPWGAFWVLYGDMAATWAGERLQMTQAAHHAHEYTVSKASARNAAQRTRRTILEAFPPVYRERR